MLNKGLFLACALALLSACDSSSSGKPVAPAAVSAQAARPVQDVKVLAERYAGRELSVVDVSEVQLDGASTLSVSFSVPLDPEQNFADKLHLVDAKTGKVDGAWELSDNLMELHLRHLEPQRKLILTVDPACAQSTAPPSPPSTSAAWKPVTCSPLSALPVAATCCPPAWPKVCR